MKRPLLLLVCFLTVGTYIIGINGAKGLCFNITSKSGETAMNNSSPRIFINGIELKFPDEKPIIKNGRTLVPVRVLFEALEAQVNWDNSSRTVTAIRGATQIELIIDSKKAYINEKEVLLDEPAQIRNGRTLVPARFACEAFGNQVIYRAETNEILIFSNIPPSFDYNGETFNRTEDVYQESVLGKLTNVTSVNGFEVYESDKFTDREKFLKTDKGYLLYIRLILTN